MAAAAAAEGDPGQYTDSDRVVGDPYRAESNEPHWRALYGCGPTQAKTKYADNGGGKR